MNIFNHNGRSVAYLRQGKGQPVIFLHNGGTSHSIWKNQIPDLARDHCVFAIDLPGYGASEKPTAGYSLEAYTSLLAAFIEHHDLHNIVLIGNCMGSAIALNYAASNRAKICQVIAINPLSEATFTQGSIGKLHTLNRKQPKIAHKIAHLALKTSIPSWAVLPSVTPLLGWRGIKQGVYRDIDLHDCLQLPNQSESLVGLFMELGGFSRIDNLLVDETFPPICTIWGEQNHVLSAEMGRKLNITLAPKREEFMADCGHLLMLERPKEVNGIIRECLACTQTGQNSTPKASSLEPA